MAATTGFVGMFDRIRSTLADDSRTDAELVREYAGTRADDAFAELTRRYAPMVWGVCRRTVGHHQSAEDAFQAVFLVLARKMSSIQPPSAVGGWLHGVAVHTSLRARAMTDRRRNRVKPLDADQESPDPHAEPTDPDVIRVLDAEIARLPEKLRTAVALCELDGLSRRDAAKRLNIAEGTLSSRLAAGRKALAARLRSRGVALGVGGIAALVGSGTAGAAPPLVATASETVSALAEGAIRTMFLSKLKLMSVAALAVIVLAGVGVYAVSPVAAKERPSVRRNAPVPKVGKEGVILVGVQEDNACRLELITPKGEKLATIPLGDTAFSNPTLSRDGRRVAVWANETRKLGRPIRAGEDNLSGTLRVYDLDQPDEPVAKFEHKLSGRIVFAPDGQTVFALEQSDFSNQNNEPDLTIYKFDLKAKKKEKLDLPPTHQLADISPDGTALLTTTFTAPDGKFHATPHRVPLDTLKPEPLTKEPFRALRFSSDGKRMVGMKYVSPNDHSKQELTIVDLKDGKESGVKLEGETLIIWALACSPDGKRLVVNRTVVLGKEKAKGPRPIPVGGGVVPDEVLIQKVEVTVLNLDGSDPKPLLETKKETHIFGLDWR